MKKFFSLLLLSLIIIPAFMFSACSSSSIYQKQQAFSSFAPDYIYALTNRISDYEKLVEKFEDKVTEHNAEIRYQESWNIISDTNKALLFALTGYDMYELDKKIGEYDLKTVSNDFHKDFTLYKDKDKDLSETGFICNYHYTGKETDSIIPSISIKKSSQGTALQDIADDVIKFWGANIKFEIAKGDEGVNITTSTHFKYPSEYFVKDESTTTLENETDYNYKIVRDDDNSTIFYVYIDKGSKFTKKVSFTPKSAVENAPIIKKVEKYNGDITQDSPDPSSLFIGSYDYEFSNTILIGTFKTIFNFPSGNFWCRQILDGNIKKDFEIYNLVNNVIVAKYDKTETNKVTNIEFVINADSSSGKLKNTVSKSLKITKLSDSPTIPDTFGELTSVDKKTARQIAAFSFANMQRTCECNNI